VSSASPDYIEFKVQTLYENSITHLSPMAYISIAQVFTLSESSAIDMATLAQTDIGAGQDFVGFKDVSIDAAKV
jgi:hypothetical protein